MYIYKSKMVRPSFNICFVCKEGFYYQCYASLQAGKDAASMRATKEGWGGAEAAHTVRHDWNSLQTNPMWQAQPQVPSWIYIFGK